MYFKRYYIGQQIFNLNLKIKWFVNNMGSHNVRTH